ncbi:MAG: ATP-binding protein [Gemmatimonadales bacterium]|nr:ATP-binding protein [Gemmatimonadales bacterium]
MFFLSGARQVGKTTSAQQFAESYGESFYFNWDNQRDRALILQGPDALAATINLDQLRVMPSVCILDEIHKYGDWKNFLKGLFDTAGNHLKILVTGSDRLDVFKTGGDSLMGRYFSYRLHPLSVGELINPEIPSGTLLRPQASLPDHEWDTLLSFGGFPEPFLKRNIRFSNRWQKTRSRQLLKEDLRDLTRIRELGQIEILAELIIQRAGQLTSFASLARSLNTSPDSARRWMSTLEALYFCFTVRPWHKNVSRSLRKEPKFYVWDWSVLKDRGARHENLVASALLKSVHTWTDNGLGEFELFFLRTKDQKEVDFLVSRDGAPWFLVEVKTSGKASLSPNLPYFQQAVGAEHAFQVAFDLPYVARDCFSADRPLIVPARTFLSQLI